MKTDNPVDVPATVSMLIYIHKDLSLHISSEYNFSLHQADTHKILPNLKLYYKQINTWEIDVTKKLKI